MISVARPGPLSAAFRHVDEAGYRLMDRRTFFSNLALGACAMPRSASAQTSRAVARIGILRLEMTSDMVGPEPRGAQVSALFRGLQELGYQYGQQFVTEPRGAGGKSELVP